MGREDQAGEGSASGGPGASSQQAGDGAKPTQSGAPLDTENPLNDAVGFPRQSPLFHAEHAARYERQRLIEYYENEFDCRLVVLIDTIFPVSIVCFEELVYDANPEQDLHLLLQSPGGDGETAVRLARAAQARCRQFTVVVPDQAKSAATVLAMGAHRIVMGPTSDLGPVDPQFQFGPDGQELVAAKDLLAAVAAAEEAVSKNPDSYPLHAAMLADVTEVMLQQARSALDRTDEVVLEALKSNPDRTPDQAIALRDEIKAPLIDLPKNHGAIFGAKDAHAVGLPVVELDPQSDQWKLIWMLYAKYAFLGGRVYEGRRSSRIL